MSRSIAARKAALTRKLKAAGVVTPKGSDRRETKSAGFEFRDYEFPGGKPDKEIVAAAIERERLEGAVAMQTGMVAERGGATTVTVKGYTRADGTVVKGYTRAAGAHQFRQKGGPGLMPAKADYVEDVESQYDEMEYEVEEAFGDSP